MNTTCDRRDLREKSFLRVTKGLVINYGEGGGGGGLQNCKIVGPKLFAPPPPPQDRVKLFGPPLFKSGNFSCPAYNMAKTLSYHVNTTPKLVVPPFNMAKTFSAPPLRRGKTL